MRNVGLSCDLTIACRTSHTFASPLTVEVLKMIFFQKQWGGRKTASQTFTNRKQIAEGAATTPSSNRQTPNGGSSKTT